MTTRSQLIAEADAAHVAYRQYANYWDAWAVATARKDIRHRGQVVLRKGQAVLVDPASHAVAGEGELVHSTAKAGTKFITAYVAVNRVNTVLRAADLVLQARNP